MKETGKMWKITRQFYLVALVVVLLFVVWNCIYICDMEGFAFDGKSVEQTIIERIESKSGAVSVSPAGLAEIVNDKMFDMTLFGRTWTFIGITFLMTARYFAYADVRTREFQMTWPICKWKRSLFDYVALLFLIIVGWATEVLVLFTAGNHYNKVAMQILTERSLDTSAFQNLAAENKAFLLLMSVYLLYMILFYTFLFLGMTAAKNPLLGIPVCLVWYLTLMFSFSTTDYWMWCDEVEAGRIIMDSPLPERLQVVRGLNSLLFSVGLYEDIDIYGLTEVKEYSNIGPISNTTGIIALVLLAVLMFVLAMYISKKKELSSGKLIYSHAADICLGICLVITVSLYVSWMFNYYVGIFLFVIFLIVAGYYFFLKRTRGSKNWEVK